MVLRFKKGSDSDILFGVLSSLNELRGLNTDLPQYVNHTKVYVKGFGEFILRKGSSLIDNSLDIIKPTTGSGRWIKISEANVNNLQLRLDSIGTIKAINGLVPDSNGNVVLTVAKSVNGISPDSNGDVVAGGEYDPSTIYNKRTGMVTNAISSPKGENGGATTNTGTWVIMRDTSILAVQKLGTLSSATAAIRTTSAPTRVGTKIMNTNTTFSYSQDFYYEGSCLISSTSLADNDITLSMGLHHNSSMNDISEVIRINVIFESKSNHFVGIFRDSSNNLLVRVSLLNASGNTTGMLQNDMLYYATVRFDRTKNKYFFTLTTLNILNDAKDVYTGEMTRPYIPNPQWAGYSALYEFTAECVLFNHSLTSTNQLIFNHMYTERQFK